MVMADVFQNSRKGVSGRWLGGREHWLLSQRPRFSFQHPQGVSQSSVNPIPGDPGPSHRHACRRNSNWELSGSSYIFEDFGMYLRRTQQQRLYSWESVTMVGGVLARRSVVLRW